MANIKFYLNQPRKETSSIYVRFKFSTIRHSDFTKYDYFKYYLPETIEPKFWDVKNNRAYAVGKNKYPLHTDFNRRLDNIEYKIKEMLLKYENTKETPAKDELKKGLDLIFKPDTVIVLNDVLQVDKMNLSQYTQHLINTSPHAKNTIKSYGTFKGSLERYEKKKRKVITFKNADIDFYNDYIKYLTKTENLSKNTVGTRIKILKTILRNADERGLDVCRDYQKKSFLKPTEKTDGVYLTTDEIDKIYNLNNLPAYLERARDMFVLGCNTGLRVSDLFRVSKENINGRDIDIKTQKTGETVSIPITAQARVIMEKYDYQFPKISNQKYNDFIKEVAKRAEINDHITREYTKGGLIVRETNKKYELVSSHTARRSFATNAYLADVPTLQIMKITGHKTESAFMKYIKMSAKDNARKLHSHPFFNRLTIAK